jgi:hypothetical protein
MPIASLPCELLRTQIIRAHIGASPSPLVLAMRRSCRKFRDAAPVWDLLKLRQETVQWLLNGETEVWTKEKNTPECGVLFPSDFFYAEGPHKSPLTIQSDPSNNLADDAMVRIGKSEIIFVCTNLDERAKMYSESGRSTLLKTDIDCAAVLSINNKFFVFSNAAELFCIDPVAKYANALPLIDRATDMIQKFDIPEGLMHASAIRIKHFRTNNQKDIWILTFNNKLAHATVSDATSLRIIANDVRAICLLDNAVLCVTLDQKLKLLALHNAAPHTIFITTATSIQPVPSLRSVWFCTQDGTVHRRGAPLEAGTAPPAPRLDVGRLCFTTAVLAASLKSIREDFAQIIKELE